MAQTGSSLLRWGTEPDSSSIVISPDRVALWSAVVIVLLLAAHIVGQFSKYFLGHDHVFGLVRLTDLNSEAAVPSWFASVLLLACGAALAVLAAIKRACADLYRRHWLGLAVLLVYLSLDESAAIHELWGGPIRRYVLLDGFFRFAWVLPGMLAVAAVAFAYARFVWNLPAATRRSFVMAGTMYVGGGLAVEMLSAKYLSVEGRTFGFSMIIMLEEGLEMAGAAVLLYALLQYLAREHPSIRLASSDERATLQLNR